MKILVHDYPGHPFQPQLSRHLARKGHQVLHVFFSDFQAPRGALTPQPDDPPGFAIRGISLGRPFEKYNFFRRVFQEMEYGRRLAKVIGAFAPDVALAGNAPLDIQAISYRYCRKHGIPYIYWHQDIYSVAIDRILRRKLPLVGAAIGARYIALEKRLLQQSDHVVTITDDFLPILTSWGVARERITVIENWAAREDLTVQPRDNAWAREHGLVGKLVFLYSGTLGLKHNPDLLLQLAKRYQNRPDVRVVVNSEGLGADWLREHGGGLPNLVQLPFQPFERLPEVLASGDVLIAVLEPDAGIFSVPSKVLTYLCAGRPLLGAIPLENQAARMIMRYQAGLVVPPDGTPAFLDAAAKLADDPGMRERLGNNALDYATRTFDIDAITRRFEELLERVVREAGRAPRQDRRHGTD
jgi:glycosyltransferase involved in cell wall biosynthesis